MMEAETDQRKMLRYFVIWLRLLFGFHLIYSGLRSILGFEVLGNVTNSLARDFVLSLEAMGMYAFVKFIELAVGIMLVINRAVPLVLLIELPISVVIFWLNTFIVGEPRQLFSGPQEIILNVGLMALYGGYYINILSWRAEERPLWRCKIQNKIS